MSSVMIWAYYLSVDDYQCRVGRIPCELGYSHVQACGDIIAPIMLHFS